MSKQYYNNKSPVVVGSQEAGPGPLGKAVLFVLTFGFFGYLAFKNDQKGSRT